MFLTLTYSPENIPENNSLKKHDLQLFVKRLRKNLESEPDRVKIKYFACGEYGDQTQRPHYHAIIFGMGLQKEDQMIVDTSWSLGHTHFGTVTPDSIRYVAQYIDKKLSGEQEVLEYENTGRQNTFRLLSQGLGKRFCQDNEQQLKEQKSITLNGVPMSIPRYYIKKLDLPMEDLKQHAQYSTAETCEHYTGINVDPYVLYRTDSQKYTEYHMGVKKGKEQHNKTLNARIALKKSKL